MNKLEELQNDLNIIQSEIDVLKSNSNNGSKKHLFVNAPVMVKNRNADIWLLRFLKKNNECFSGGRTSFTTEYFSYWDEMRLPTVDEAPRDIWLSIDGTGCCPDDLTRVEILVELRGRGYSKALGNRFDWRLYIESPISRYMIIGEK